MKRKFNLVELLIVGSILAILLSMFVPHMRGMLEHSKSIHCVNNLRQIGMCIELYAEENQDQLPWGYVHGSHKVYGDSFGYRGFQEFIGTYAGFEDYTSSPNLYVENGVTFPLANYRDYVLNEVVQGSLFDCPVNDSKGNAGYNYDYGSLQDQVFQTIKTWPHDIVPKSNQVSKVYDWKVVMFEMNSEWGVIQSSQTSRIITPHELSGGIGGFGNYLFIDGHVESQYYWKHPPWGGVGNIPSYRPFGDGNLHNPPIRSFEYLWNLPEPSRPPYN